MSKFRLYLLSPFREKYNYFLHCLGYFCLGYSKGQNQNLTYPFSPTQFLVNFFSKKIFGSNTFQFCSYKSKRIFKFSCFSWYYAYIFEIKKLNILIQNLMLNRLAPISNPKMKKQKLRVSFLNAFFRFLPFFTILDSREISSKSV